MCYRDLSTETSCTLLEIMETLLDSSETNKTLKVCLHLIFNKMQIQVHPNNVVFCIDLIERILFELGEGSSYKHDELLNMAVSALEIIGKLFELHL